MYKKTTHTNTRPLVLLDVDGVINDLDAMYGVDRPWTTTRMTSNGYVVHIPQYMPTLIQQLVDVADVWWCTTWRDRANAEIAAHLGIDPLPVITDGTNRRSVTWKAAAAREQVAAALAEHRDVYWIEDFYGDPPVADLPEGVTFIDTTIHHPRCVLTVDDLPGALIGCGMMPSKIEIIGTSTSP